MTKIGFIGMGNMAKAIVRGFILKDAVPPENILAYAPSQEKLKEFAGETGIISYAVLDKMIQDSDIILIAVKPDQIEEVITPVKELLKNKVLLSVAAGWDYDKYDSLLDASTRHLFIMPSTPVQIGEGISLFEQKHSLTADEFETVEKLFSTIGLVQVLPGNLMSIGGTVSACTPAFLGIVIEAIADGGVKHGLPRDAAYKLASQVLIGTGKTQLETGQHPGEMKDAVCSPGGLTIQGVVSLENDGFRAAIIRALDASVKK
ncbi:pyrroline-5-carboxylate reductase [Methanimicrococcus blatticola]|uniref:Pyrroline-5-carboxylate reductase n=1 Tax=Methanimicrococcus blatticola TaxID=91560 RepID=A0A484F503_9EURY|nr:pyrroline-5-carboxylate reductase [Methanimicrococcus blatticola]MBZ3936306.1 pyrroline-5-carboxylate reductase [Methanimicrococcus blatticola]MCC2508309.1 pyrroline-5-carboxylate reductase [Methanimicrococcus blatticola]TDQ70236.1 pyrroline-5-carboxylate reductase [Methanimicrococcus blatticola]